VNRKKLFGKIGKNTAEVKGKITEVVKRVWLGDSGMSEEKSRQMLGRFECSTVVVFRVFSPMCPLTLDWLSFSLFRCSIPNKNMKFSRSEISLIQTDVFSLLLSLTAAVWIEFGLSFQPVDSFLLLCEYDLVSILWVREGRVVC
jgi:hypothetical protein